MNNLLYSWKVHVRLPASSIPARDGSWNALPTAKMEKRKKYDMENINGFVAAYRFTYESRIFKQENGKSFNCSFRTT